jgi:DNA phosphorothioation-associated putative methyltransferase
MDSTIIQRHKTAISRCDLSKPISIAQQHSIISKETTVFDYGCGKGGDVRILVDYGYSAKGWDPVYFSNNKKNKADIVNLGYVINVIEDQNERVFALCEAFSLAQRCLVVSAQVLSEENQSGGEFHSDGVRTSRNTFQKYYTQSELRDFIGRTLRVDPVAASPGIFYVFKTEELKEEFLAQRIRRLYVARPRHIADIEEKLKDHREILQEYANAVGEFGRIPKEDEFDRYEELKRTVGRPRKCIFCCEKLFENFHYDTLRQSRIDDLLVYMALSNFNGHIKQKYLPPSIKRDVREFFGDYETALNKSKELLFSVGRKELIEDECRNSKIGKLLPDALYVHKSYFNSLSPILRVYVGCATKLSGDMTDSNIIKIMRKEKSVSFLVYKNFDKDPHPKLSKSTKIYLKDFKMAERKYNSDNRPILHRKETFVGEDYKHYNKFKKVTRQEEKAELFERVEKIGFSRNWEDLLKEKGYKYKGHKLFKINK